MATSRIDEIKAECLVLFAQHISLDLLTPDVLASIDRHAQAAEAKSPELAKIQLDYLRYVTLFEKELVQNMAYRKHQVAHFNCEFKDAPDDTLAFELADHLARLTFHHQLVLKGIIKKPDRQYLSLIDVYITIYRDTYSYLTDLKKVSGYFFADQKIQAKIVMMGKQFRELFFIDKKLSEKNYPKLKKDHQFIEAGFEAFLYCEGLKALHKPFLADTRISRLIDKLSDQYSELLHLKIELDAIESTADESDALSEYRKLKSKHQTLLEKRCQLLARFDAAIKAMEANQASASSQTSSNAGALLSVGGTCVTHGASHQTEEKAVSTVSEASDVSYKLVRSAEQMFRPSTPMG